MPSDFSSAGYTLVKLRSIVTSLMGGGGVEEDSMTNPNIEDRASE